MNSWKDELFDMTEPLPPRTCMHKVTYDRPCRECDVYFARQFALDEARHNGDHHHELPDFALLSFSFVSTSS